MLLDCPVATKRKGIPGNSLTNQIEDSQVADGELLKFAERLQVYMYAKPDHNPNAVEY